MANIEQCGQKIQALLEEYGCKFEIQHNIVLLPKDGQIVEHEEADSEPKPIEPTVTILEPEATPEVTTIEPAPQPAVSTEEAAVEPTV